MTGRRAAASRRVRSHVPSAPIIEDVAIDGMPVRITYKRIKNITLRVKPPDGGIEVSAPLRTSPSDIASLVRERRLWIERAQARVAASPSSRAENASPAEVERWRAVVEACVPVLLERWEPVLGVKAGKLAFRNMKSRWGSCRPDTGRICINVRLALYPPECLEYVVVHELAHLIEHGHGPRFRAILDAVMPDWKNRRDKLR